jgi:hypothetical protein
MDRRLKAWQLPPRLITGAYFLNAGLSKRGADDATAGQLHGFAAGTYPLLGKLDAKRFTGLLPKVDEQLPTCSSYGPTVATARRWLALWQVGIQPLS